VCGGSDGAQRRRLDHGVLFCWENGKPPHPDTITRRFKKLARAADLPEIDLHDARHSDAVEVKWAIHPKGDQRSQWVAGEQRSALAPQDGRDASA
jgi:hypothetical protein